MAAHMGGAIGDAEIQLVARALGHRGSIGNVLRLKGHPFVHIKAVGAGDVRFPRVAIETGIEMNMPFNKTGHQKVATQVDDLCG